MEFVPRIMVSISILYKFDQSVLLSRISGRLFVLESRISTSFAELKGHEHVFFFFFK